MNIYEKLEEIYPSPVCELKFNSTFELLVSVILSAQCTDKRVNQVTEGLFKSYNTPEAFLSLSQDELEKKIYSCGFYHNKAKNILSMCADLVDRFGGIVPDNFDDLISLAGVGKKTASVVLAVGYGIPRIAVDTHVFRLSKRLGLADEKTPEKTQVALEKKVPKKYWIDFHYALVLHGRYICKSQRPKCNECKLVDYCKYYKK